MAFGRTSLDFRRRRDLEDILQGCISNIFIGDFFSRNPEVRGGGIPGLMHNDNRAIDQLMIDDLIRRHNLVIQLTNSLVDSRSNYAEVHPKILDAGNGRGRYPRDFELPKRLDVIYSLGLSALERILESYGINTRSISSFDELPPLVGRSRSDSPREARIRALLEFLGVNLSDNARSDMSSSRSGGAFGQLPPRPGFLPDNSQSSSRQGVVFPRSRPGSSDLGYDPATQMPPRMNFLLHE